MGFSESGYRAKSNDSKWRFIGEVSLNINKLNKAIEVGGLMIDAKTIKDILYEGEVISGFSGLSIQFNANKSTGVKFPSWRVVNSNKPQKSFSISKYGFSVSFLMAVNEKMSMLGLDLNLSAIESPPKEIIISHIRERLSLSDWEKSKGLLENIKP